jgi:hypothetical protein
MKCVARGLDKLPLRLYYGSVMKQPPANNAKGGKMAKNGNGNEATNGELPEGMRIESIPKARRGRRSYVWQARLAPVMQHPGQEIRVRDDFKSPTAASRTATNLKKGRLSVPESNGEWTFAARTIQVDNSGDLVEADGETRFALYARFDPTSAA